MASSNSQSPRLLTSVFARLVVGAVCGLVCGSTAVAADWPVVYQDDFDDGMTAWEPTDAAAWKVEAVDDDQVLRQHSQSDYQPPHRSPVNIALLRDLELSDFQLDVDVRSTARDYPHRSVCLFFGHQDPAHFYYVHLGQRTDDHANQIFIVNDEPRTKISTRTTPGTPWDNEWHHVRIIRDAAKGTIQVYFDDLDEPVMTATDKHFIHGRLGLGSFDDTGDWDHLVIRGKRHTD